MGAPCINLKLIVARLSRSVDGAAIKHSVLFYIPSLVTTLVSFLLFSTIEDFDPVELNQLQVTIMSAVILSLLVTGGIQYTVFQQVSGETSTALNHRELKANWILLGTILGLVFCLICSFLLFPVFIYVFKLTLFEFLYFAVLLTLFSAVWVSTTALWASEHFKEPAIIFSISYWNIFFSASLLNQADPGFIIVGYTLGISILLALLTLATRTVFNEPCSLSVLSKIMRDIPALFVRNIWGIMFQIFFTLALFLDKIMVWISEGIKAGNGLQILGPYTTGAFLGLIPMFSLIVLSYFGEKVKRSAKDMYKGTLADFRWRIEVYRSTYWRSVLVMLIAGMTLTISVVSLCIFVINDKDITLVAATTSAGALFFNMIMFNSYVLPVFHKDWVSATSMITVCAGVAMMVFLTPLNPWYSSLGFLLGSFAGFLLSQFFTVKLLREFDYRAYYAFQTAG